MATAAQKAKVGIFLLLSALLIGFGLAGFLWPSDAGRTYPLVFEHSIQGLQKGSAVTYMGVPVGEVVAIDVTADRKPRARIRVRGDRLRLREGVRAKLVIRSFAAGSRAISLTPGHEEGETIPEGARIPTEESAFESIQHDVREIAGRLNRFLAGMEGEKFAELYGDARGMIRDARQLLQRGRRLVKETTGAAEQVRERVGPVADRLERVAAEAERLIAKARGKLERIEAKRMQNRIEEALDAFEGTSREIERLGRAFLERADRLEHAVRRWLEETRPLLRAARRFLEQLRANPASLIRGKPRHGEGKENP